MATEGSSSGSSYLRVALCLAARRNFVRLLRGRIWQPVMGTGPLGKGVGDRRSTRARGGRATQTEARSVAGFCAASGGVLRLHGGGASDEVGPFDEWCVTHADFKHTNCSGGNARARLCRTDPLVKATLSANPDIDVKALKKTTQQETGVPVSVSTATRARSNILLTDATEVANSYLDFVPGVLSGSLRRVVQGVFFMNTWCLVSYR